MSAIDQTFEQLKSVGKKAFIPFVTAGDPDIQFTMSVIQELARRGCSLCEIGIPYSDPIADGPIIQASYTRALDRGFKLAHILDAIQAAATDISAPVITMVSYAIVHRLGLENYVRKAQGAGVSGAIIPDLPVEEAQKMSEICQRADFGLIQLVTPTTPSDRALRIAETSTGFLYYVSVTGITGERSELPADLVKSVAWLRERTPLPVCIGFGISQPEHVQRLAPVADGLIVGSAIVRRMADAENHGIEATTTSIGEFVSTMIDAMP